LAASFANAPRPGGLVLIEGYGPAQPRHGIGGPRPQVAALVGVL